MPLDYLFVDLDYIFFLKFAGIREYPRTSGYPRIVDMGITLCLWRVAGAGVDTDFGSRVRSYQVYVYTDFTRCHP